jgi:hypothetical protein
MGSYYRDSTPNISQNKGLLKGNAHFITAACDVIMESGKASLYLHTERGVVCKCGRFLNREVKCRRTPLRKTWL